MRSFPSMIELAALGASVIAVVHLTEALRGDLRGLDAISHAHGSALAGSPFRTAGMDALGRKIGSIGSEGRVSTGPAVVFLLRAASYRADIDYWNGISAALAGSGLYFLAFCDGRQCAALALNTEGHNYSIIAYGQVSALETLYRADKIGQAIILDRRGVVSGAVSWRGKSREATASLLLELR